MLFHTPCCSAILSYRKLLSFRTQISSTASAPAIDAYYCESVMPERVTEVRRKVSFQFFCSSLPCWFFLSTFGLPRLASHWGLSPQVNMKTRKAAAFVARGSAQADLADLPRHPRGEGGFCKLQVEAKQAAWPAEDKLNMARGCADSRQWKAELVWGA